MFKHLFASFKISIRYHIIFWVTYFLFNFVRWGSYFNDYWYSLKSNLVEFSLNIVITYFVIYFLIPRFLLKKKYFTFLVLFFTSLGILYLIRTGLIYLLVTENIWPEADGHQEAFSFNHIVAVFIGQTYVIALASVFKLTYEWIYEKKKNEELQKIQLQTELDFLKSQIQPHFFFNTLNNLYALVINKSDNAADVVLKLSEIMQYVLYEVKTPKISLIKEINYIYTYLELEKLRYGDQINSNLEIEGNLDGLEIPPLLFLPFIENCFKHGTKNNIDIKVDINFEIKNNFLFFTVANTFQEGLDSTRSHGIGIQNVKRRLELLYQNNYSLETVVEKNLFKVLINIPVQ